MSKYTPQKKHAPVDETVQLPAAIRAASARSSALHNEVYGNPQEGEQQGEGQQPPANEQQETPPTPKAGEGQPPREEPNGSAKREQTTPQPEAKAPSQEGQEGAKAPADEWQHKYNSLKGRFDQQTGTITHLNNKVAQLEQMIARFSEQQNAAAKQPPSELSFEPLKPEEVETYGEDFISVAQRAAMAKLSPEVQSLRQEIHNLKAQLGQVATTTEQTSKQNMFAFLDREEPNWRAINRSPEFLEWANLPDAFSGVTRLQMMRDAYDKGDGPRVLAFFKGFLKDEAATAPVNTVQPDPKPQGQKVPLEQFAAPGRAKAPAASVATAPGEKETITHAQIAAFYRDVNMGKYRGNDAEKERIEQMIFDAQREGRIV